MDLIEEWFVIARHDCFAGVEISILCNLQRQSLLEETMSLCKKAQKPSSRQNVYNGYLKAYGFNFFWIQKPFKES